MLFIFNEAEIPACKHRLTDDYILLKLQKRVVGIIIKVPCCVTTSKLFIESNILKFTAIMYLKKKHLKYYFE